MAKYDFETIIERRGTGSLKWDAWSRRGHAADELPLWVADMDFKTVPAAIEALTERVAHGVFGYSMAPDGYYEAVQGWFEHRHGWRPEREWFVMTPGVVFALAMAVTSFTQPGDAVIIQPPVYYPFRMMIEDNGRKMVTSPLLYDGGRYTMDYEGFERELEKTGAKLFILCNPHNPVGRAWTEDELRRIGDICLRHNVVVVADEIHADLILPGHSFVSMASLEEKYLRNCAVSTSCTKTFNIAAIKGAAVVMADEERRRAYRAMREDSGRDILSYAACIAVWERCEGWLDELLTVLDGNFRLLSDFCRDHLPEVGVTPLEATYLPWLDFRFLGMEPGEQERFMGEKARCFFTEGYHFGAEGAGFERWSIACPRHVLEEGLVRMERAIRSR